MPVTGLDGVRRLSPGRTLALLALAALLAAALWQAPDAFRQVSGAADRLAAETPLERSLSGALATDVDRSFLVAARSLVPPGATYAVVTGSGVQVSTPVTLDAVAPFAAYWLLPRRLVRDPKRADWVLSFGGDLRSLGLRYARVVEVSKGLEIAEVRR